MSLRRILTVDNAADLSVLKQISTPVEGGVTDGLRALMDDMLETMYAAPGIGLAAVQIGEPKRVIVMDLGDRDAAEDAEPVKKPLYFVNPEIVWSSEETAPYEEGCLSVPGIYDGVTRHNAVHVHALDDKGQGRVIEAQELLAVCIQHEMDHLMGKVFVEYLSPLKRNRIKTKMLKAQREDAR